MTGAGGTGKSEVVKALREFSQRWGIADALCVTATTGIAACVVHGMTWHKATGHFSFMKQAKTVKVRELWSTIALLGVDEMSMLSARQLHQLDKWLRDLKGEPDVIFGGVHVIFCGDFFQLPPVKARPIYDDGRAVDGDDAAGRELWRRVLNAAVVLSENHRAKLDPAYAELLRILRKGSTDARAWEVVKQALLSRAGSTSADGGKAWAQLGKRADATQADVSDGARPHMPALNLLAQRVGAVLTGALQQRLLRAWRIWARTEVMVITPRNRHRIAINRKFTEEHIRAVNRAMPPTATWRQRGVLLIDGVFHRYRPYDRNPPRYDEHWQKTWRRIATEETMGNKYAPVLSVIIGRRYMLTQNVNLSHGVANGMWAVVRDVRLREGAVPRWDKEAGAHRIDATDVEGLVVRYPDRDWGSQKLHTDLPLGHFLIALDDPANAPPGSKRFDIELGGDVKKFRVSQFPLIQAGPRDAPSLVPPLFMRRGHVCPLSPLRPSAGARGQRPQGAGPDTAPDRDRTPLFQGRHR